MSQSESFNGVMEQMAAHEGVPLDQLMFLHNDEIVHHYQTPLAINLRVADILGKVTFLVMFRSFVSNNLLRTRSH